MTKRRLHGVYARRSFRSEGGARKRARRSPPASLFWAFPIAERSILEEKLEAALRLRRRGIEEARSDLHSVPGPAVNGLLFRALAVENRLIARGVKLAWGSSVFGIGRR